MRFLKSFSLFCFGGLAYGLIELAWRGRTHISMFFVGGLCFWLICKIATMKNTTLPTMSVLCSLGITLVELLSGIFINIVLKLGVWSYQNQPFNILGQVCPVFSLFWLFLSIPAIYLSLYIRKILFSENSHFPAILPKLKPIPQIKMPEH